MAERLRINWTSTTGFGHEEDVTGDRLVTTVNGTTAVIRVHAADGGIVRVLTRTGVNAVDWWPTALDPDST